MKLSTLILRTWAFAALTMAALTTHTVQAQTPEHYNTADGLPSTRIAHIMFDEQDFLWVSTDLGLSRFCGDNFVNHQAHVGNPYQLQENRVNCMYVDAGHSHWVGACDGLYYLCRTENKFTRYPVRDGQTDVSVSGIVEHPLRPHTLLLSTNGYGVQVFDTKQRAFVQSATDSLQAVIGTTDSPYMMVDSSHRLWVFKGRWLDVIDLVTMQHCSFTTDLSDAEQQMVEIHTAVEDCQNRQIFLGAQQNGVLKADLTTMHISRVDIPATRINAIALSPDCMLAIGTEGEGLWGYDPVSHRSKKLVSIGPVNIDRAKVKSIAFDEQENLWLGIYQQGVLMLPGINSVFSCNAITTDQNDLRNLACITDFVALPDGGRAYALDGAGIVVDYADHTHRHYEQNNSDLTTNAVITLAALPDGSILAGTFQRGVFVIGTNRKLARDPRFTMLDNASISDFAIDKKNKVLYIATNGNGLYTYRYAENKLSRLESENFSLTWLTRLYLCADGRLWISMADHLRSYDTKTGTFSSPAQPNTVLAVNDIVEDDKKCTWMASSHGLLYYDAQRDSIVQIDEDDNSLLPSYASILYSEGRLWLSSTGRITSYDPATGTFTRYTDMAIARTGTMSLHAAIQWPDSVFSFGGDNGALTFRPQTVYNYHRPQSPLYLQRLWVDNVLTDYDPALGKENVLDAALWCATTLQLPAQRASFSLSYDFKDVNGSLGYICRHRMKGYEKDWHHSHGSEMIASYQSLPPGSYVLEIIAQPENETSGQSVMTRELKVEILYPWYETWWAQLMWLLIAIGTIAYSYNIYKVRRQEKKALRKAELSRQLKEEKLDLLTSVSHEIKTPLTLIISPLRKLMLRKGDLAMQSVLETMYRNSLRILMLVNQQMDVRKLEHGKLQLHVVELSLRTFLDDMMQYFSNLALSRHITYELEIPESYDNRTVWADPQQIDKVILNLLSNALKFTPDNGTVRISVSSVKDQDGADCTRISVYNSGSQLPDEQQSKAFAGIGLSIAHELVALHHGNLSVRNLEDGVAFDIDLLEGSSHFSPEELTPRAQASGAMGDERLDEEGEFDTEAAVETANMVDQAEQDLVEQLSDELREKQRLRERRSNLGFDYNRIQMSSADEKLMQRVVDVIHKNMSDSEFSVETLSREVGISRVHLNRKLKELIDTSPSSLIKSVRLKQAAFLLVQSNVTIAEVAYSVGFSSPAYFSSNFSQFFGMTPKEFTTAYTENPDSPELKQLLEL